MQSQSFTQEQFTLLDKKKYMQVIANVYDRYTESSRPVILSQIKKGYLMLGKRDDKYEKEIQDLEKNYPQYKKEINDFKSKNPWDQQKIQSGIGIGKEYYNKEFDLLILKLSIIPAYIKKLTITKDDSKLRRIEASKKLQEKHEKAQTIDVKLMFENLVPLLSSDKPYDYIPATLFATGRRTNELANKGTLTQSDSGIWYANFNGQSKTGTDLHRSGYEIPLLAPYSLVKSAWDKSRLYFNPTSKKDFGPRDINNKTRGILKHINKYPLKYGTANSLHNYRAIYAAICTDVYDRGNISKLAYVSHILGENSISPVLHYSSINLINVIKPWDYK